jgi:hypothetical protein
MTPSPGAGGILDASPHLEKARSLMSKLPRAFQFSLLYPRTVGCIPALLAARKWYPVSNSILKPDRGSPT